MAPQRDGLQTWRFIICKLAVIMSSPASQLIANLTDGERDNEPIDLARGARRLPTG